MDFLIELVLEIYLSMFEIIVPDHKFKKWQEVLLKLACLVVSLIIIAGIFAGICILIDGGSKALAITFLVVAGVLLTVQLTLFGIVLGIQVKRAKQAKIKNQEAEANLEAQWKAEQERLKEQPSEVSEPKEEANREEKKQEGQKSNNS